MTTIVRPAEARDVPRFTDIYNHYVTETPTTFDTEPFTVEQRMEWFGHYSTAGRHRLLVAERDGVILGYTSTSRFHARAAYDTTVETTILCAPEAVGQGIGSLLYGALFDAIRDEDIHLVMALVTLPNDASCRIHEKFGYKLGMILPRAGRKFGRFWDVAYYMKPVASRT